MGWVRRSAVLLSILVALAGGSAIAEAQAWVDYQGSLRGGLSYSYGFASDLLESEGEVFEDTFVTNHNTTFDIEYVPLERLAVSVALPLIGLKYDEDKSGAAYAPHGPYDDGDTHFTLQDMRADVRYMILDAPLGLSVNLGVTVPVADYPVKGSAAAGRHLKQARLGLAAGVFMPFLPKAFIHGTYEFALSEKFDETDVTAEIGQNRSDASLQIGYFILETLNVSLASTFRMQHDGVDFVDFADLDPDEQEWHDPLLKEQVFLLGLGVSYNLTETIGLNAGYSHFISGRNTLNSNIVSLGVGWNVL
jgi:hypothetical protein